MARSRIATAPAGPGAQTINSSARLIPQLGRVRLAALRARLATLPAKTHEDELVKGLDPRLKSLQAMVSFPPGHTPSQGDVKKLNQTAADLILSITSKR